MPALPTPTSNTITPINFSRAARLETGPGVLQLSDMSQVVICHPSLKCKSGNDRDRYPALFHFDGQSEIDGKEAVIKQSEKTTGKPLRRSSGKKEILRPKILAASSDGNT